MNLLSSCRLSTALPRSSVKWPDPELPAGAGECAFQGTEGLYPDTGLAVSHGQEERPLDLGDFEVPEGLDSPLTDHREPAPGEALEFEERSARGGNLEFLGGE